MIFIWATALVIGILVFVHELGHYLAARSVGVRVEKFSIGFPPRFFVFIAIISNATKQSQKILISTLSNCLKNFDKNIVESPALLVIGKNVLLSPILNWYSTNKRNISFLKQNKKNHEQYNFI